MSQLSTTRPSRRVSLRRAVRLETDVLCDLWDTRVPLLATDLSDEGLWLQSQLPLEVGDEVLVSFRPPRWQSSVPVTALASVVRVGLFRRRPDAAASGMGLRFTEIDEAASAALSACLRGLPPPLPGRRPGSPPPLRLDQALSAPPANELWTLDADDPELTLIEAGQAHRLVAEGALLTGGGPRSEPPLTRERRPPLRMAAPVRRRERVIRYRRKMLRQRLPGTGSPRSLQSRPLLRAI